MARQSPLGRRAPPPAFVSRQRSPSSFFIAATDRVRPDGRGSSPFPPPRPECKLARVVMLKAGAARLTQCLTRTESGHWRVVHKVVVFRVNNIVQSRTGALTTGCEPFAAQKFLSGLLERGRLRVTYPQSGDAHSRLLGFRSPSKPALQQSPLCRCTTRLQRY